MITSGEQTIPASLLDVFRGYFNEGNPEGIIRKRYPYRLPLFQKGGVKVTVAQQTQRDRFSAAVAKFKTITFATKQRWYATMPPWNSLLWYYDWFMMSGLMSGAAAAHGMANAGCNIAHYSFTFSSAATQYQTVAITAVDPSRAVVYLYGCGWREEGAYDPISVALCPVEPYIYSFGSSKLILSSPGRIDRGDNLQVTLIEYQ